MREKTGSAQPGGSSLRRRSRRRLRGLPRLAGALCLVAAAFCHGLPAALAAMDVPRGTVSGSVRDHAGKAVRGAVVSLLDARQAVVATRDTGPGGEFAFEAVAPGTYLLRVVFEGFLPRRLSVTVRDGPVTLAVSLDPPRLDERVTVTANPGRIDPVGSVSQQVNIIDTDEIGERAKTVVAQVANEEAGLSLQRTSPSLSGIFVRGLTGNKVGVFVDGQR